MIKVSVTKVFQFEAAHILPSHNGKCSNLHGHSYAVEVSMSGPVIDNVHLSNNGMVVDFSVLSHAWKVTWESKVDHQLLNDLKELEHGPPTAENLAMMFFTWFASWATSMGVVCERVRVWETASGYAEVTQ
jgi:6-pyruvoyltetrahydropterin/6-carboxytetrahydropterin synthase